MKVLHSAALLRPSQGMLNQMMWEKRAAEQLALDWDVGMYCPRGWPGPDEVIIHSDFVCHEESKSRVGKVADWLKLRYHYYQWLLSLEDEYDVFILRYYVHDPFQLYFLKKAVKPVFFVHHTLEVPELAMPGAISSRARSFIERCIGPYTLGYATGLIGVTHEILDYEKHRGKSKVSKQAEIVYPNGIEYCDMHLPDRRAEKIEILFVSSFFSPWHGLDLLINNMKVNRDNFILHIAGVVSHEDLQYLVSDKRVVLHGQLTHDGIKKLSAHCHCGLSSFALDRNGMKEACTLKVREYLMLGLPVYAGYQDVFPDSFSYYKKGGAILKDILNYSYQMAKVSKKEIVDSAKEYIDKRALLNNLYQEVRKQVSYQRAIT